MPNAIASDERLTLRDIGLLTYMLSLPDDWAFSISGLNHALPNDGRDAISASLSRIERAGYLQRKQMRGKCGRVAGTLWTVSDLPIFAPDSGLPEPEKPDTEKPDTVNPTLQRTDGTKNVEREGAKRPTRSQATFVPPSIEQVREYVEVNGYHIDPSRFCDYYTANGWHVGKTRMRDWKAAVRFWEQKERSAQKATEGQDGPKYSLVCDEKGERIWIAQ